MTSHDSETNQAKPTGLLRFFPLGTPPTMYFFVLADQVVDLGRANECAIQVVDDEVSRQHARLEQVRGTWRILDSGSVNGVFVNGKQIKSMTLSGGEVIRLGSTLFRFFAEGPSTESGPLELKSDAVVGPAVDPSGAPPALEDRVEDIPLLVKHWLEQHGKGRFSVAVEALESLCCQDWPEGVQQLEDAVRKAIQLAGEDGAFLGPEHFDGETDKPAAEEAGEDGASPGEDERATELKSVLRKHGGDVLKAASELDISRSQLYRRAQKFGIKVSSFRK
jgi:pSer/pThr/pTyr-binding forkhead associated (FHA) protein